MAGKLISKHERTARQIPSFNTWWSRNRKLLFSVSCKTINKYIMLSNKKISTLRTGIVLFGIILLFSCERNDTVTYNFPDCPIHRQLEVKELNSDYLFRYAYRSLVYDSLLIIATLDEAHHICVFNRYTGQEIMSFGKKGNGPDELITPTEYSIDYSNGLLYVNDYGLQVVLCYDLKSLNAEEIPDPERIKFPHSFRNKDKILFVRDSLFISPDENFHFLTAYPSRIEEEVTSPIADKEKFPSEKAWNHFMKEYAHHAVCPNGSKYVVGSALGGILEIFDLSDTKIKRSVLKLFYEPIFKRKGHVYRNIKETIGGFGCLVATNNYLYATVHGIKNPPSMPTKIYKFDWEGNPIECLHCPHYPIECFCINEEDGLIYAIAINQDGEQCVVQMK